MNLHPADTPAQRRLAACAALLLASSLAQGEPVPGDDPGGGTADDPPCVPVTSTTTPLKPTRADGSEISYCWGSHTWNEPADTGHPKLYQSFYFYPSTVPAPGGPNKPHPLVMYFHPNGSRSLIDPATAPALYDQIVRQANDRGWTVVSAEFRHPVVDENVPNDPPTDMRVPHWDIAYATQFFKKYATALDIDPKNTFSVGFSRGSLSLWTTLQPNMATPEVPQSTRVNAFFGYQAQSTYSGQEFATLFIVPQDQQGVIDAFELEHPKYAQFGSALDSVDATSPPAMLRYEDAFGPYPVPAVYFTGSPPVYDTDHFPGYGQELCLRYQTWAPRTACSVQDQVPFQAPPGKTSAFSGYIDFFATYLK